MIEPAIVNWRAWLPGTMKRGVLMVGCESAIEQGPRAFDAVGVDITPQPFFGGVVDALMQRILIAAAFVTRDAAFQGRYAQETFAELLTFVPLRGAFPTIRKTLSHSE